jgi:predicted double-glycine peptidase
LLQNLTVTHEDVHGEHVHFSDPRVGHLEASKTGSVEHDFDNVDLRVGVFPT